MDFFLKKPVEAPVVVGVLLQVGQVDARVLPGDQGLELVRAEQGQPLGVQQRAKAAHKVGALRLRPGDLVRGHLVDIEQLNINNKNCDFFCLF